MKYVQIPICAGLFRIAHTQKKKHNLYYSYFGLGFYMFVLLGTGQRPRSRSVDPRAENRFSAAKLVGDPRIQVLM